MLLHQCDAAGLFRKLTHGRRRPFNSLVSRATLCARCSSSSPNADVGVAHNGEGLHEAGHAVAASVLGTPIKRASMDGVTTWVRVGSDQARRNGAIIAMAGIVAETKAMKYGAEQCAELLKTVWAADHENAKRYLGSPDTLLAMRQARWLMHDNWDGVVKVAEALEKHGKLTGEEVAALLS